jgi:hypothetical protein
VGKESEAIKHESFIASLYFFTAFGAQLWLEFVVKAVACKFPK